MLSPRSSTAAPVQGVSCAMLNGTVFIFTSVQTWSAPLGSNLAAAGSWTVTNSGLLGYVGTGYPPTKTKATTSAIVGCNAIGVMGITMNGINWRQVVPFGGAGNWDPGVLSVNAVQQQWRAQLVALVGAAGGAAQVVASGIVNEQYG